MFRHLSQKLAIITLSGVLALPACGRADDTGDTAASSATLTVYSGRSKALVDGLLQQFAKESGVEVKTRYGKTTALANTLIEEGANSPADVFFAQDAGALGAVAGKGLFSKLPDDILQLVEPGFRDEQGMWVGTSGRARVVAYNTSKLTEADLPDSIKGFTDPKWKGRIGWPPTNASFQAFVTGMRRLDGDDATRTWLRSIVANAPKTYPKNTPAVRAVAAGEIDVAFVNHYYLHRLKKEAGDKPFPVANYHPRAGGAGAMMNVAGVGVLATSKNADAAHKLVRWLLDKAAQKAFVSDNFEFALAKGADASKLKLPSLKLGRLEDLQATLQMLRDTKVLP